MDVGDVDPDPIRQVSLWQEAARAAGEPMVDAMALATASPDARPSARMVLLRGLDDRGLVFFTDYGSDKSRDLDANPRAALVLHWHLPRHRQVRVAGTVERVSTEESDVYWATRPPGARRSAAASRQSRVIESRALLEEQVAELALVYPDDTELPRPERWGGYRVKPESVELWEEGPDRLHDRLRYRRDHEVWTIERLSP